MGCDRLKLDSACSREGTPRRRTCAYRHARLLGALENNTFYICAFNSTTTSSLHELGVFSRHESVRADVVDNSGHHAAALPRD